MTDRFMKIEPSVVAAMHRKAEQAAIMRAYVESCAHRAMADMRGDDVTPEVAARAVATWNAVVEVEREMNMPVPAYIAPVKRWAGGPATGDAWYWDRP